MSDFDLDALFVPLAVDDSETVANVPASNGHHLGRPRPDVTASHAERPASRRRRAGAVTLVAAGVVGMAFATISGVSVYLSPDGAHYLADADALLGRGVRGLLHLPLFPLLVAAARGIFGDLGGFAAAIAVSLGLLVVALYLLLRRWLSPGASLLGAALGTMMPTTAELLGWGGGATLLATACAALTLAAMEAWIGGARRGWMLTGATLALTALSHPFVFAVTVVCLAVRWGIHLARHRRIDRSWSPLGLKGIAAAAAVMVPAMALAVPFYRGIEGEGGFSLGFPHPGGLADLLGWALRADPLPWLLLIAGVVAPLAFRRRGPAIYLGCLGAITLAMATMMRADASYVSRVAYLVPIPVALGAGIAAEHAHGRLASIAARTARPRSLMLALALGLAGALALTSFAPRLDEAARFYQLLEPGDVEALRTLREEPGAVATSWYANDYGAGVSTSWFAEGLAKRPAYGPTAPWRSTVAAQREAGADMQRLFAGPAGIENGVLQLAAGSAGMRADPAIQVWSDGFYFPVLYANTLVNSVPDNNATATSVDISGGEIRWSRAGRAAEPHQAATLRGNRVEIRYRAPAESPPPAWSLWFWPAYGVRWKDVRQIPGGIQARQGLPGEEITFRLRSDDAEVSYHAREARFGVEAIQVHAKDARSLTILIEVDARAQPGRVQSFDEAHLIARRDIGSVVVWKDTGWRERFEDSACYARAGESPTLLIYRVNRYACGATR